MRPTRLLVALLAAMVVACASPRAPTGFDMSAADERAAASLLAGYLLASGWTVRLAGDGTVEASRDEQQLRLAALLDPDGVDRVLVTRSWPRAATGTGEGLAQLAVELNRDLNVGLFSATPETLDLEASLYFLDVLEPRLLEAFLAFTDEVLLAVLQVQGERTLLAPVEGGEGSR